MIIDFKIFEEVKTSNKHPFSWYKGKWYIHYGMNHKSDWEDEIGYLTLISEMVNPPEYPINGFCKIRGESINLKKSGEVKPGGGLAYSYTKKEFDKLDFLTTEELFNKHTDIFISLFNKCVEDIERGSYVDHYMKQVKYIFSLFEPMIKKHPKEFNDYLVKLDAKKYNL